MKTFSQFLTDAYDPDVAQGTQTPYRGSGEGGRVKYRRKRSSDDTKGLSKSQLAKKRRVKAVGGGKTEPVDYKPRKDIGTSKPTSKTQQQPEQPRGSAALSAKEAQKKAYRERKAREAGAKTKTADELLSKKSKPKTHPNYKPRKVSGLSAKERKALYKKGERTLRDIRLKNLGKKKESELKHRVTSK